MGALFPQINTNIFDSSINWNLALRKSYQFSVIDIMSEESKNNVPQIAITAYEFNEDDIEVTNLFNATHEKNMNTYEPRSVSPNITKQKSKIILKSPITNSLSKSLSPVLSDFNNLTDTEVISDSDDEKYYIRSPNLSPGLINYFILTDVEDLSEDEEHEKNSKVNEEHTDTENFTGDKEIFNEMGQTEKYLESASYFQQPHKEIIFHSKDGNVRSLTPTEESNPIWLKTPNEEVKGFDSEEEIITADECGEQESYLKNNNTYYHDIDVGVVDSVESIKHEQCKHKYRNRLLVTKKNVMQESEFGKKRFRHKNRSNSEIIESSEKPPEEFKKKILSKYTSEPTLNKIKIPKQNQNIEQNRIKHQKTNNKFVIHDNKNDISISIDFESNNSVLLNVGRHFGNLSMRWCNNEIMTGRAVLNYNNLNILEPLEPGYIIRSSLYDSKRQFEVDLFTYGTMKILQNRYFTYITVYNFVQPVNIVQLYINRPFQTQINMSKNPLVKMYSLKDKCTSIERLYPSPVTRLSAFKIFNQKVSEKNQEQKHIKVDTQNHVSNVINIFESMSGSPKLRRKFNFKKLSKSNNDLKKSFLNQKPNCMCIQTNILIGKYRP
jgi:hypothetical protein